MEKKKCKQFSLHKKKKILDKTDEDITSKYLISPLKLCISERQKIKKSSESHAIWLQRKQN